MNIISSSDLTAYLALLGTPVTGSPQIIVDLANGVVSDVWTPSVDPTAPVPATVKAITLEVASRPFRNPAGVERLTRAIDDGSRTEQFTAVAAQGGVFLTDAERSKLDVTQTKVGSIRIGLPAYPGGPATRQTPYGVGSYPGQYEAYPDSYPPYGPYLP